MFGLIRKSTADRWLLLSKLLRDWDVERQAEMIALRDSVISRQEAAIRDLERELEEKCQ